MDLKQLQQKRNELAQAIRDLADRQSEWTAEDRQKWDEVNAAYNTVMADIETAKADLQAQAAVNDRLREIEAHERPTNGSRIGRDGGRLRGDEPTNRDRELATNLWFRNQMGVPGSEAELEAAARCGLSPNLRNFDIGTFETDPFQAAQQAMRRGHPDHAKENAKEALARHFKNELTTHTGTTGGFTIGQTSLQTLELNMLAYGSMMQTSEIMRTAGGEPMPWPTADDTGNKGRQIGESKQVSQLDPNFAQIVWYAYKFTSDMIRVPAELLEDSSVDIARVVFAMIGERLGRILNEKATTGTGAGTFDGIINAASLGITAGSATAISPDEIIQLEHSVDPAYRAGAAYMMHDQIVEAVRLLKDGDQNYLWRAGLEFGRPDTLNGRPLAINQDMDSSIASGAKSMLFGQLDKYKIRQVAGVRVRRLVERYADEDQEGFVAFTRADGHLLDAGTAPVKYLEH